MDPSRYQLVDSLYGPGTVGACLLTLCAVFVSWTVNVSSRSKDTISIDFIAALLLPAVAAGHLVFQVVRLPISVAEAMIAREVEKQKYASAMEAPLNVCETFSIAALLLAVCCGPWWESDPKLRRLGLVLVVGLLSWGTENMLFLTATMKGVNLEGATLSRPYLFLLAPMMASTWGFFAVTVGIGGIVWVASRTNAARAQKNESDLEGGGRRETKNHSLQGLHKNKASSGVTQVSVRKMNAQLERALQESRISEHSNRTLWMMSSLSAFYLPSSLLTSILSIHSSKSRNLKTYSAKFILIPSSNGSMSNLDQILALVGGVIVLLAAVRHAYRSRSDKEQSLQKIRRRRRSI
ncbi:hypothetical protein N431DRAFT_489255 [Stipitochalara longipes BDJ]|nr:hypothetical protein N431DRAFT_489255 [Stipitochalara longipes BDJ]